MIKKEIYFQREQRRRSNSSMRRKQQDSQNSYCLENSYAIKTASSRRCLQTCQSTKYMNSSNMMDQYKKRQINTTNKMFLFDNFIEQKQDQKENPKPFFSRRNSRNSRNSSNSSNGSKKSCRSFNLNRKVHIK